MRSNSIHDKVCLYVCFLFSIWTNSILIQINIQISILIHSDLYSNPYPNPNLNSKTNHNPNPNPNPNPDMNPNDIAEPWQILKGFPGLSQMLYFSCIEEYY